MAAVVGGELFVAGDDEATELLNSARFFPRILSCTNRKQKVNCFIKKKNLLWVQKITTGGSAVSFDKIFRSSSLKDGVAVSCSDVMANDTSRWRFQVLLGGPRVSVVIKVENSSQKFQLPEDIHGLYFGMSFISRGKSILSMLDSTMVGLSTTSGTPI